ncbi:Origin recognition complex subunit 2 [Leucoagaricus sp. SymC.cos]|nr:Origin recognition complex subunit 2 [Leucoagaricus sp. SymC.cos]
MPPQLKRQHSEIHDSEESEDSENQQESRHSEDDTDQDEMPTTSSPFKAKAKAQGSSNIIVQTSFDAYFTYTSSRAQTSSNVFSNLVLPLSAEEYGDAIASAKPRIKRLQAIIATPSIRNTLFSRFLIEMEEGFNILCYGYGSKRQLLNQFATEFCSKKGHVVIANGFQPDFAIKDLLNRIENIPGILELELSSSVPEKQVQRISKFFSQPPSAGKRPPRLYIIIHNIDSPTLRAPRNKAIFSLLALVPNIHIITSIDHLNAPLIWSSSESSTRKTFSTSSPISPPSSPSSLPSSRHTEDNPTPPRGFSWLYHDLTTLSSYDFELTYIDRTSLTSAHGGGPRKKADFISTLQSSFNHSASLPGGGITNMSETAALHILASVTQKAQKLFILLAKRQLVAIEDLGAGGNEGGSDTIAGVDLQATAIGYDALFNLVRADFVATNDTALIIVSAQGASGSGGEVLWIPLRKERLANVLQTLQSQVQ